LIHNWRLKLSALGLSVFLWALVQTEPLSQEVMTSVPVVVNVADTTWTVSGAPSPPTVELRVGGPAGEIIRLAREGPSINVPIESVGAADTVIALRRDWIRLGERTGVTVESVNPPTVRITFERAATRNVPVLPRLQGSLPGHLALAEAITLNPEVVRVRGPNSRVGGLESIRLQPFDLSVVRESGVFTVSIDTSGLAGGWTVPASASLGIEVEVEVERTLAGLAVVVRPNEDMRLEVSPATVQVRLTGARTLVTGVRPSQLEVSVAPELLTGMVAGEERKVPLRVEGAPDLVTVVLAIELVTVRRTGGRGRGAPPT
jgi:hypothetical protein